MQPNVRHTFNINTKQLEHLNIVDVAFRAI